jgi:hypothetical protein
VVGYYQVADVYGIKTAEIQPYMHGAKVNENGIGVNKVLEKITEGLV